MSTQREQLRSRLIKEGFPDESFDVAGAPIAGGHVLDHEEGWWTVRVVDDDEAKTIGSFEQEGDACEAMWRAMQDAWPVERRFRARLARVLRALAEDPPDPALRVQAEYVAERGQAWLAQLETGSLPPREQREREGLHRLVLDSWPLAHPLPQEVGMLEMLYRRL